MNKVNLLKILFLFLVSLLICKCFYSYIKEYKFKIYEGHGNFISSGARITDVQSGGIKCECGPNCEECDPNTQCGEGSLGCHNHNPQGGHNISTVAPSNVQSSEVSVSPQQCEGSWSNCNINCTRQWTTASGQPDNCIEPQSSSAPVCNPGEGECPVPEPTVPDVDCFGAVSQCTAACETADQRTVNIIVPQSGNGVACPIATDCQPGDGQCAVATCANFDCSGVDNSLGPPITCPDNTCTTDVCCTVPPPTPVDCVLESESDARARCPAECGPVTQTVTTEASGGGACAPVSYDCQPGDGACPATPAYTGAIGSDGQRYVWHRGEFDENCATVCARQDPPKTCSPGPNNNADGPEWPRTWQDIRDLLEKIDGGEHSADAAKCTADAPFVLILNDRAPYDSFANNTGISVWPAMTSDDGHSPGCGRVLYAPWPNNAAAAAGHCSAAYGNTRNFCQCKV